MALLEIRNIVHGYDASTFLNNVSLQLEEGQIGCLMGPSGAGKTTVLACVAGIERPQSGVITINGKTVFLQRHGHAAGKARHRHGLSRLRFISASDGDKKHRFRHGQRR